MSEFPWCSYWITCGIGSKFGFEVELQNHLCLVCFIHFARLPWSTWFPFISDLSFQFLGGSLNVESYCLLVNSIVLWIWYRKILQWKRPADCGLRTRWVFFNQGDPNPSLSGIGGSPLHGAVVFSRGNRREKFPSFRGWNLSPRRFTHTTWKWWVGRCFSFFRGCRPTNFKYEIINCLLDFLVGTYFSLLLPVQVWGEWELMLTKPISLDHVQTTHSCCFDSFWMARKRCILKEYTSNIFMFFWICLSLYAIYLCNFGGVVTGNSE